MTYVLVASLSSQQQGRTLWFKQMTAIGPMTTPERSQAAEFETKEDALNCPAMFHVLSVFDVFED